MGQCASACSKPVTKDDKPQGSFSKPASAPFVEATNGGGRRDVPASPVRLAPAMSVDTDATDFQSVLDDGESRNLPSSNSETDSSGFSSSAAGGDAPSHVAERLDRYMRLQATTPSASALATQASAPSFSGLGPQASSASLHAPSAQASRSSWTSNSTRAPSGAGCTASHSLGRATGHVSQLVWGIPAEELDQDACLPFIRPGGGGGGAAEVMVVGPPVFHSAVPAACIKLPLLRSMTLATTAACTRPRELPLDAWTSCDEQYASGAESAQGSLPDREARQPQLDPVVWHSCVMQGAVSSVHVGWSLPTGLLGSAALSCERARARGATFWHSTGGAEEGRTSFVCAVQRMPFPQKTFQVFLATRCYQMDDYLLIVLESVKRADLPKELQRLPTTRWKTIQILSGSYLRVSLRPCQNKELAPTDCALDIHASSRLPLAAQGLSSFVLALVARHLRADACRICLHAGSTSKDDH